MIKKIFTLLKLGRKVAKSDIIKILSKFQEPPVIVKILFSILAFSFTKSNHIGNNENEGEKLSNSLILFTRLTIFSLSLYAAIEIKIFLSFFINKPLFYLILKN